MSVLERIISEFIVLKSSDLHLAVGKPPKVRVCGELQSMPSFTVPILNDDLDMFVREWMPEKLTDWEHFLSYEKFSIDGSLAFSGRRFRTHFYRSSSGTVAVFRLLSERIPSLEQLNLPKIINSYVNEKKGLILITGATGSGKSTTLASILNEMNLTRKAAIVTVEDPIEYTYNEQLCSIEQREVGVHVSSFGEATRDMLREDPDIILVGEMRDLETVKNAISLAETGHLVLSTLHAKSTTDTVDRIVDLFPGDQQNQVRMQFANVLIAVINQNLIHGENGMVPLVEILGNDNVIASMIKNSKNAANLRDYIRSNDKSVHIVDNAAWHIENKRLTLENCKGLLNDSDLQMLHTLVSERGFTEKPVTEGVGTNGFKRRF